MVTPARENTIKLDQMPMTPSALATPKTGLEFCNGIMLDMKDNHQTYSLSHSRQETLSDLTAGDILVLEPKAGIDEIGVELNSTWRSDAR